MSKYADMFYSALMIRMVEEKIIEVYPADKIQSPVHLSIGQEHHAVAICAALDKEDQIFATYRNHAVYLAKGGDLKLMFAELYGKHTGIAKGKAGSMHLCAPNVRMMGSSAIVGSVFAHVIGAAYALKIRDKNNIVISFSGDGATEEGVFHECLNFASLKNLPLLFIVENNGLAIHSPIHLRQSYSLKKLSRAYRINYVSISDNFDMRETYKKIKVIKKDIVKKNRPFIVEIKTYRYKMHVGVGEDYDKGYRRRTELERFLKRDPLVRDGRLIKKYRNRIQRKINAAIKFAEESPQPAREELLRDVY